MCGLQFTQLFQKYYSYPKRVTIDIVPSPVPFPAISLCNMRNLDIIVLNNLKEIINEVDRLQWVNYTTDPFLNEYLKVISKYYPMFFLADMDIQVFETDLTRSLIATNIDRDVVTSGGVPFKEFIVTCRFGGRKCNRTGDFHHFFD